MGTCGRMWVDPYLLLVAWHGMDSCDTVDRHALADMSSISNLSICGLNNQYYNALTTLDATQHQQTARAVSNADLQHCQP